MNKNTYRIILELLFSLIIIFSLNSCQNNKDKIKQRISEFQSKQINLPYIHNTISNKDYTIATFIDGNCKVCIEELKKWEKWIEKDSSHVRFAIYLHATDPVRIQQIDSTYWEMKYQLIPDTTKKYLKDNNLDKHEKIFQTFLLDKKGKVLLTGNPLSNNDLTRLYRQIIYSKK